MQISVGEKIEKLMTQFALAHRKDKGTIRQGERISRARQRLRIAIYEAMMAEQRKHTLVHLAAITSGIKRVQAWLPNMLGTEEQYNDLKFALEHVAAIEKESEESADADSRCHLDCDTKAQYLDHGHPFRDPLCAVPLAEWKP
jgi:hypothetical protein